jgi:hypothetical protein
VTYVGRAIKTPVTLRGSADLERIICEHDSMADENIITKGDTVTDKRMTLYFYSVANSYARRNLYERSNKNVIAKGATIEIYGLYVSKIRTVSDVANGRPQAVPPLTSRTKLEV